MKASELKKLLEFTLPHNFPVLIKGQPGVGKSDIVDQAVSKLGYELIISHPVVSDPTDYKGLPFVVNGKADFLPFGELDRIINATSPLVFFFDDLGQATPAVQSAVMQLLLARQINGHKVSDHVRFIAATNRRVDMANVSGILEPVKSRFYSIVELELNIKSADDVQDWLAWGRKNNMPASLLFFIESEPKMLNDFKPSRDLQNSPCPRTVAAVGRMLNAGLPKELFFEVVSGAAGESFASGLKFYMDTFLSLPTIGQIENDPYGTPVPSNIQSRFAIASLLTEKMNAGNIGKLISYSERMEKELQVSIIKTAAERNPQVAMTRDFAMWASKNVQNLM